MKTAAGCLVSLIKPSNRTLLLVVLLTSCLYSVEKVKSMDFLGKNTSFQVGKALTYVS
jgi:hypothetical protein